MSAYLVHQKEIAVIARWFYENTRPDYREAYNAVASKRIRFKQVSEIATILAQANVDSVATRYDHGLTTEAEDRLYVKECAEMSKPKVMQHGAGGILLTRDPSFDIDPASVWNLCSHLDYQSSEVNDWVCTDAYWIIRAIQNRAAELGMKTDSARMTWGWVDAA
jgi:hypothetical protein